MDEIDLAQANDELFRRQALTAHFRRRASEGEPGSRPVHRLSGKKGAEEPA